MFNMFSFKPKDPLERDLHAIETWLGKHARRIAKYSLRPPATAEALSELESFFGHALPEDFHTLYRWHDGMDGSKNFGSLFYGFPFFSLDEIRQVHSSNLRMSETVETAYKHSAPQIDGAIPFNKRWLQWVSDGARAGMYVDLAPTASGKSGQIIFLDPTYEKTILVADSITQVVADVRRDMEHGMYGLNEESLLFEKTHELVTHPSIDLLNWSGSKRWRA